ncbi:hypothetical protein B0H14DRAFT_3869093 [Mycena olivaceomarginata]|nr:hypothetical protein B0H14DRAFT_3869093 [Mycena olivaceomarginata]
MPLTIHRATNKDRVLHYGTVAATLLKDIGNASNQPYLQAIASVSLLIMETVQARIASLEKILAFVRNQVKGGLLRRMFRSMEDAALITECNAGLKHGLDVFGVQSGMIAMTMAGMQKDAKQRHEELIAILEKKRSIVIGGSKRRTARAATVRTDRYSMPSTVPVLPASPKIFYGRDQEITNITNLIIHSKPARIAICGAEGLGKTAIALAASHSPEISQMFGARRYFFECDGARDYKQLLAVIALQLGLEGTGRKHVIRHLTALAAEQTPVLVVLDALDRAWKPHDNRTDLEDFLSLLADIQHLTLIAIVRGGELPRQVKWTRPFLPMLQPLSRTAARATFLDISDVGPEDPDLEALLDLTENHPASITHMALLASFEGCASLLLRWHQENSVVSTLYIHLCGSRTTHLSKSSKLYATIRRISYLTSLLVVLHHNPT